MTEAWVLLFWIMLGNDAGMSATSQAMQFQSEEACRAGVEEIYAGLDPAYRDETGHGMGVHAICIRTDAPDTVTLDEMNDALQGQAVD